MAHLLLLLVPICLVVFWLWMFYDMLHNEAIPDGASPGFGWPPETRNHWLMYFIFLNVFTAGYYYFTVYQQRD